VAIKPLRWLGSSIEDVRAFPEDARREAGHELFQVQNGLEPSDWKPMKTVGAGVQEIRIHTGTDYRVFYIAKLAEAVYVIHAFEKRTRHTPQADINIAKKRLSDLKQTRQKRSKKK
jgi:phage-related protein